TSAIAERTCAKRSQSERTLARLPDHQDEDRDQERERRRVHHVRTRVPERAAELLARPVAVLGEPLRELARLAHRLACRSGHRRARRPEADRGDDPALAESVADVL